MADQPAPGLADPANVVLGWDEVHRRSPAPRHRRRLVVNIVRRWGCATASTPVAVSHTSWRSSSAGSASRPTAATSRTADGRPRRSRCAGAAACSTLRGAWPGAPIDPSSAPRCSSTSRDWPAASREPGVRMARRYVLHHGARAGRVLRAVDRMVRPTARTSPARAHRRARGGRLPAAGGARAGGSRSTRSTGSAISARQSASTTHSAAATPTGPGEARLGCPLPPFLCQRPLPLRGRAIVAGPGPRREPDVMSAPTARARRARPRGARRGRARSRVTSPSSPRASTRSSRSASSSTGATRGSSARASRARS